MDLFSRKIVGWAARPTIHRELVIEAIARAVKSRHPRNTLTHSDQGTQHGSDAGRRFCKANHLEPSMSRRANCWDNTVAESCFGSLKKERIKKRIYSDRETTTLDLAKYIDDSIVRYDVTAILAASVRTDLKPCIASGNEVFTKSWYLQCSIQIGLSVIVS